MLARRVRYTSWKRARSVGVMARIRTGRARGGAEGWGEGRGGLCQGFEQGEGQRN